MSTLSATSTAVVAATPTFSKINAFSDRSRTLEVAKSQYRVEQQVKLLHLQAEAESLLQRLHIIKQRQQVLALGELKCSDKA